MEQQDPFPAKYYENQKVGDSDQERFEHFQGQLDNWKNLRAPKVTPKHLRAEFMKRTKVIVEKARDFYKARL